MQRIPYFDKLHRSDRKLSAEYILEQYSQTASGALSAEVMGENGSTYIVNAARGRDEGDDFTICNEWDDCWVSEIRFFHGKAEGYTVLKAMEVEWNDGGKASIGEHSGEPDSTIWFDKRRLISDCTVRAGSWLDGIDFWTVIELQSRKMGGEGGIRYPQDIGNGRLIGFHGSKGKNIGQLGLIFGKKL